MPNWTLTDLSGGMNNVDELFDSTMPPNQVRLALNIDYTAGGLGQKRRGCREMSASGGAALTGSVVSLLTQNNINVWITDNASTPITKLYQNSTGMTTWVTPTFVDAISSRPQDMHGAALNGKFFLAYTSAQNRLHVYDGSTVRRVGIAPGTNAPTVANGGTGTYAAVLRYYRVRWLMVTGSVTNKKSEPTPSVSFTPSGSGNQADVTQPTVPSNEGITHWIVEASTDNVTFFNISGNIAVGTTSYSDSAATTTYANNALSEPTGYFTLPPSFRAVITDGNRILGITGSRIYFTAALGTLDRGDDERLVDTATQKPWLDLNASDGGNLLAIARTVNGVIYAFKLNQVWRLTATGDAVKPYVAKKISDTVGCVYHKAVCTGEDAAGNAVVYFLHIGGLYRVGPAGIEYCGRDVEGLTRTTKQGSNQSQINIFATTVIGHLTYVPQRAQVFMFYSLFAGGSNSPDRCLVFNVRKATRRDAYGVRGGWARYDTAYETAVCSTLARGFDAGGEGDPSPDDTIWLGGADGGNPRILTGEMVNYAQDDGTNYQATVTTFPFLQPLDLHQRISVRDVILSTDTSIGELTMVCRITPVSYLPDQSSTAISQTLVPGVFKLTLVFDSLQTNDLGPFTLTFGDDAAQNGGWSFNALTIRYLPSGARS